MRVIRRYLTLTGTMIVGLSWAGCMPGYEYAAARDG